MQKLLRQKKKEKKEEVLESLSQPNSYRKTMKLFFLFFPAIQVLCVTDGQFGGTTSNQSLLCSLTSARGSHTVQELRCSCYYSFNRFSLA